MSKTDLNLYDTDSTVQYTVAIRQAPHPLLSFCALTAQIRRLLACDLNSFVQRTLRLSDTPIGFLITQYVEVNSDVLAALPKYHYLTRFDL